MGEPKKELKKKENKTVVLLLSDRNGPDKRLKRSWRLLAAGVQLDAVGDPSLWGGRQPPGAEAALRRLRVPLGPGRRGGVRGRRGSVVRGRRGRRRRRLQLAEPAPPQLGGVGLSVLV